MRPIPFGATQEAWFLRPNLEDRVEGPEVSAPNKFAKEFYRFKLPCVKDL